MLLLPCDRLTAASACVDLCGIGQILMRSTPEKNPPDVLELAKQRCLCRGQNPAKAAFTEKWEQQLQTRLGSLKRHPQLRENQAPYLGCPDKLPVHLIQDVVNLDLQG